MSLSRRQFLFRSILGAALVHSSLRSAPATLRAPRSLFDGKTLTGWRAVPRMIVPPGPPFDEVPAERLREDVFMWHAETPGLQERLTHLGHWRVEECAIIGGPQPADSRLGAYLLSEQTFADFELELEARPDWPVDTGIMIRAHELGCIGFQVLLDHRPGGGVAGVFGNSIGNFLAAPFTLDGDQAPGLRVANLREGPRDPRFKSPPLNHAATFADFAGVWRPNDWNHLRIRCVGRLPVITTWVNGLKICELDTAKITTPGFDPEAVFARLGRAGHIAFEVHDLGPKDPLGPNRWAAGAVCRWRNITITELPLSADSKS